MVFKIALTGAHGTGKTTLAHAIAIRTESAEIRTEVTHEVPRALCRAAADPTFFRREKNTALKQALILLSQTQAEAKQMQHDRLDLLICDRALMDHWAYTSFLFGQELRCEGIGSLYEECVAEYCRGYDLLVFVPIEFLPVDDGTREADVVFQRQIDTTLHKLLDKWGIAYLKVSGSVQSRYSTVILELFRLTGDHRYCQAALGPTVPSAPGADWSRGAVPLCFSRSRDRSTYQSAYSREVPALDRDR